MALRESGLIGLADNRKRLRSAVFLVELLNIDLFNYRERNQHADNFEGTVYRGMAISGIELERYYESLTGPLSERYQSVPLAMVSASRTPKAPIAFALHEAELDKETAPVIWEIHIHSLDPHLLASYHTKYPTSVVTSLCAVPIERISDLPIEEEVFLRGPFFQILGITVDYSVKFERPVHRITAVVLNSNRDHISAIASNKGADQRMRDLFRTMVLASRSTTCAEYAEELGRHADAKLYRTLAAESYSAIDHYLDEP
jgi:hypothetical protein